MINIGISLNHSLPVLNLSLLAETIKEDFPMVDVLLIKDKEELTNKINDIDLFIGWGFDKSLYKLSNRLKTVITPSAGHDWVPEDPSRKIKNIYGSYHGKYMSETLLASILYFNNRLNFLCNNSQNKIKDRELFCDRKLLSEQNFLIIGYGSIGRACAALLKKFDVNITGLKRRIDSNSDDLGTNLINYEKIIPALQQADHVILILPNTNETDHFFKKEYYDSMKKTAFLYNIGRGNCIDTYELINALKQNTIAGAYLDVIDREDEFYGPYSKLWDLDNILLTPHISGIYKNCIKYYYDTELKKHLNNFINHHS